VTGTSQLGPWSIAQAMAQAQSEGIDRLDAQLMIGALLNQPRGWLIAHDDLLLTRIQSEKLKEWVSRRRDGEPLAYLLGQKEFYGLMLEVGPSVLVPRPETELLVDWGLRLLQGPLAAISKPSVIDLGTGSGAIALAIKHRFQTASVVAVDSSAAALETASRNAGSLKLPIDLAQGGWWDAVPDKRFDLALSNPPYIADGDPHLAALRHEPQGALIAHGDGMADLEEIINGARAHLNPEGWLLLEHGHDQANALRQRLASAGFAQVQTLCDLAGLDRCTGGRVHLS
jgi:release factor glutamine methyltransferase